VIRVPVGHIPCLMDKTRVGEDQPCSLFCEVLAEYCPLF
jgi:hypothetical protein